MTSQDLVTAIKKHPLSICCGTLSVIFIVLIFLRGDSIAQAEAEAAQKTAEGQKYASNIQYSTQLKEQMESVVASNKQIEARIVRAIELGKNTQYFYKIESDTGVKMIDLRQTTPASAVKPGKGPFVPVAFAVTVQGDINQIVTFLTQVENGAHYCRVMSASCSGNSAARTSPLTLALSIELLGMP